MDPLREAYNRIEYLSYPRAATAPDRLAAVARFFGLEAPDPSVARVLEVGCSDGGNLIAIATTAPHAHFVGLDFSQAAIQRGLTRLRALGIGNVDLRVADFRAIPPDSGSFDYIIAHGVYSWVAPPLQQALLALIQRHLAPDGIAYVDYNAQPGSQLRFLFRDAILFHVRRFSSGQQRIDQARSFMKLIAEGSALGSHQRILAEAELKRLLRAPDSAIFHDLIGLENHPCYFHEFMTAADTHQLAYLGEADISDMSEASLQPEVRERLSGLQDLIEREQYVDILKGRAFRQTLLCRKGKRIARELDGSTLDALYFSASAQSIPSSEAGETCYRFEFGTLRTRNAFVKAVVDRLSKCFPDRLSFERLRTELAHLQGTDSTTWERDLRRALVFAIMTGVAGIHAREAQFTTEWPEKPIASRLARLQAESGEAIFTLNLRAIHNVDPELRSLVPLLDGSRDVAALAATLKCDSSSIEAFLRQAASHALLHVQHAPAKHS